MVGGPVSQAYHESAQSAKALARALGVYQRVGAGQFHRFLGATGPLAPGEVNRLRQAVVDAAERHARDLDRLSQAAQSAAIAARSVVSANAKPVGR